MAFEALKAKQFRNGGGISQPRPYLLVLGTRRGEA
jgi:hypothetical protein